MAGDELRRRFRGARRDPGLTVLEGFHALKHALRFGAEVEIAVAVDPEELERLAAELAPDLAGRFEAVVETVGPDVLAGLVPQAPRTGVVAIARRKATDLGAALADRREAPVVLLEQPRNMGNLGACVRVAAAADAAALLTIGENDPWHPDAVRGAAGLHYALPAVAAVERAPRGEGRPLLALDPEGEGRPLLALDPEGEEIGPASIPPRAVLAFGTERHGLSAELLAAADGRIALPMRAGVSSLNLATAVAAVLYAIRLRRQS